jgi:hypothetical protein
LLLNAIVLLNVFHCRRYLSNDAESFKKVTDITIFNGVFGQYIGYDWNYVKRSSTFAGSGDCHSVGTNLDNDGDYNTHLNHRGLLYWEAQDDWNQWFHGHPLDWRSSSAGNSYHDIVLYLREDVNALGCKGSL